MWSRRYCLPRGGSPCRSSVAATDRVGWRDPQARRSAAPQLLVEFVEVSAVVANRGRPRLTTCTSSGRRATTAARCQSSDGGRAGRPLTVIPPGLHNITLAGLAAGPRGAIGVAYYASRTRPEAAQRSFADRRRARAATLFYAGRSTIRSLRSFQNYGTPTAPAPITSRRLRRSGNLWGVSWRSSGADPAQNDSDHRLRRTSRVPRPSQR